MKVFFRKLHKIPLILRILFLGTVIFYGVAYFFIFKSLLSLTGIENFIRYLLDNLTYILKKSLDNFIFKKRC